MIFILGFRTENTDELPDVLYLGNDGVEAERIAESAGHPRVARMVNPTLYPIRHWSEEAAQAFAEKEAAEKEAAEKEAAKSNLSPATTPSAESVPTDPPAGESSPAGASEAKRAKR